jgi:hypothetical protein
VAGSWNKLYDGDARWEGQLLPAHLGGAHHNTLLFLLNQKNKQFEKVLRLFYSLILFGLIKLFPPVVRKLQVILKQSNKIQKSWSISVFIFVIYFGD